MMCTVDNDNNNNNMGAGGFLGMAGEGTHTVSQCDLYSRSIPVQAHYQLLFKVNAIIPANSKQHL